MTERNVVQRLSVRRTPAAQESLKGYLLSLSQLNGLPDYRWICKGAGMPARFATSPCDLAGLSALAGCPLSELLALPNWPAPGYRGSVKFGSGVIQGLDLDLSRPKICPACVREEGPIPRIWDLPALAVCPVHRVFLIDLCPRCGERLTWLRPGPAECKCGADLGATDVGASPPSIVSIFASWISALALGMSPPLGIGALGTEIDRLDILLRLIRFFGIDADGTSPRRGAAISKPSAGQAVASTLRASSVLVDWPDGLFRWLERWRTGKTGMGADLGPALQRLRSAFEGPSFGFLATAVRQYLAWDWDGGLVKSSSRYYLSSAVFPRMVGVTAASKVLATNVGKIGALLERGELKGRPGEKRVAKLVDSSSLRELHADRQAAVSTAGLARTLKVHRKEIGRMRKQGFLKPSHRSRLGYMFPPGAGDDLIRSLRGHASRTDDPPDGISLAEIPSWRKVPLTLVLRMIEEREIELYLEPTLASFDFGSLKVSRTEVLRAACVRHSGPMLTVHEAAEELGLSVRMIPVLVLAGCLEGELDVEGKKKKRGVCLMSVRRFAENYVLCSAVARAEGTNTASIARRLRSTDAHPVVQSDIRRGISAVWRRDDVALALALS